MLYGKGKQGLAACSSEPMVVGVFRSDDVDDDDDDEDDVQE